MQSGIWTCQVELKSYTFLGAELRRTWNEVYNFVLTERT